MRLARGDSPLSLAQQREAGAALFLRRARPPSPVVTVAAAGRSQSLSHSQLRLSRRSLRQLLLQPPSALFGKNNGGSSDAATAASKSKSSSKKAAIREEDFDGDRNVNVGDVDATEATTAAKTSRSSTSTSAIEDEFEDEFDESGEEEYSGEEEEAASEALPPAPVRGAGAGRTKAEASRLVTAPSSGSSSSPSEPSSSSSTWITVGATGVAVVAVAALAAALFQKFVAGGAIPALKKKVEGRALAKESAARLDGFADEIRAGPVADLGAKNLGDEGLAYVAFSLPYNSRLDALDLSKNGLTAKGATTLAETLAQNSHLSSLSLDTNGIGDDGAAALAAVLASNYALKSLNLTANGIGEEGMKSWKFFSSFFEREFSREKAH